MKADYSTHSEAELKRIAGSAAKDRDTVYETVKDFTVDAITTEQAMRKMKVLNDMVRAIEAELRLRKYKA